jgi:hypothetical protein
MRQEVRVETPQILELGPDPGSVLIPLFFRVNTEYSPFFLSTTWAGSPLGESDFEQVEERWARWQYP